MQLKFSIYISLEKLTCVCTRIDGMRIIQGFCDSFLPTLPCGSLALWLVHDHTKWWTNSMELLNVETDVVWAPQDPSVWPLRCGSPLVSWCVPLVPCPPPFCLPVSPSSPWGWEGQWIERQQISLILPSVFKNQDCKLPPSMLSQNLSEAGTVKHFAVSIVFW